MTASPSSPLTPSSLPTPEPHRGPGGSPEAGGAAGQDSGCGCGSQAVRVLLPRTGIGTDVHAFDTPDSGTPMRLACLDWPGEVGLAGHSDGDVVAHACADALFSAAGLGDLGSNFGTAEPQWKGAAGSVLLAEAARRVRAAGFEIGNIAVQLIGARPRVGGRMAEAGAALSEAAGAPVAFSATTTDHLGFLGREEGLAAIATALVYPAQAG